MTATAATQRQAAAPRRAQIRGDTQRRSFPGQPAGWPVQNSEPGGSAKGASVSYVVAGFSPRLVGCVPMNSLIVALLLAMQVQGVAPNIMGFSIQGTTVNLNSFKGKKNVLVVFYRTEA